MALEMINVIWQYQIGGNTFPSKKSRAIIWQRLIIDVKGTLRTATVPFVLYTKLFEDFLHQAPTRKRGLQ